MNEWPANPQQKVSSEVSTTDYIRRVWTPADAAALREVAEQFPTEIGQSDFLAYLVEHEGISL